MQYNSGTVVYIYNEDNKLNGSVPTGNGPNNDLKGYTPIKGECSAWLSYLLLVTKMAN